MKMTNRWNRFIYRLWAPVYDSSVGHFFLPGRKCAIEVLNLQPGAGSGYSDRAGRAIPAARNLSSDPADMLIVVTTWLVLLLRLFFPNPALRQSGKSLLASLGFET